MSALIGAVLALALGETSPTVVEPNWSRRPTREDLVRYYPVQAAKQRVHGRALIVCRVGTDGWAQDCSVLNEYPKGYGFGEAAVKMSRVLEFTPKRVDGIPVDDGLVRIPISFALPKTWLQKIADGLAGERP